MKSFDYFAPLIDGLLLAAVGILITFPAYTAWIVFPIGGFIFLKIYQILESNEEKNLRVKVQLDQLVSFALTGIPDLRCTYYLPVYRDKLKQSCDYIPNGRGAGRKFSNTKGIIGKTYSDKGPKLVNFYDDADFRIRMVSEFGWTEEEVKLRTLDRRSYYCYPIVNEDNKVLGVVYFDSSEYQAFSNDKIDIIKRSCLVINNSIL